MIYIKDLNVYNCGFPKQSDGWMDEYNNISVISGQWKGEHEEKVNRKAQGVPQPQSAANPRHQENDKN